MISTVPLEARRPCVSCGGPPSIRLELANSEAPDDDPSFVFFCDACGAEAAGRLLKAVCSLFVGPWEELVVQEKTPGHQGVVRTIGNLGRI